MFILGQPLYTEPEDTTGDRGRGEEKEKEGEGEGEGEGEEEGEGSSNNMSLSVATRTAAERERLLDETDFWEYRVSKQQQPLVAVCLK